MTAQLYAAPSTPFTQKGELNPAVIPEYADHLIRTGVKGVFVNGSTGESLSLTVEERKAAAQEWVKAGRDELAAIIHVGHNCITSAQELASHAASIGAAGIGAMPPVFFKPSDIDALVDWCAAVASAAPELPFYYYHIPSMTGVNISIRQLLEKAEGRIPNMAGGKFTHENLMDFQRCLQYKDGKYRMFFGRDEILLSGLAVGATSGIGSTYNYAAPLYLKIIEAFEIGDMKTARVLQDKAQAFIQLLIAHGGGIRAGKSMLRFVGIDCGPVRLPLKSPTSEEEASLRKELEQIGFFEWARTAPELSVK